MKQAPRLAGQSILKVAKVGQAMRDKVLQILQGLCAASGPYKLAGLRIAKGVDTSGLNGAP